MSHPKTILDNHLYIPIDLTPADRINESYQADLKNLSHLVNQLLVYDEIIIPTKDFGIVPILIKWMGKKGFEEALEKKTLSFIRQPFMLCYVGNGNGLQMMSMDEGVGGKFKWHQEATFGDHDKAIELQLIHRCKSFAPRERDRILGLVMNLSNEFKFDENIEFKKLIEETYEDIKFDSELTSFIAANEGGREYRANLKRLKGVNSVQARILGRDGIKDGIDLLLRIAQTNLEIIHSHTNNCDLNISDGGMKFIGNKFRRLGVKPQKSKSLLGLLELNNLPDVGEVVSQGRLTFDEFWEMRNKKNAVKFRDWLANAEIDQARDLEKLYVESLGNQHWIDSVPVKIVRFILSNVLGAIEPITGFAAGTLDSFFVDKWIKGYKPKLFIDELSKLSLTPSSDRPGAH